jgi:outer membrane receptor protein involved in Fe transport
MIIVLSKKYLPVWLLLFTMLVAKAQVSVITGTVRDKNTGQPVEEVTVSIKNTKHHTHTNAHGEFAFMNLIAGGFEIDFTKLGYEGIQVAVELLEKEVKQLHLEMAFSAKTLSTIAIESDKPLSAASSVYLTQYDVENRPKNSAQDLLRLVPGLFIAQHAGGGKAEQLFIRGFDCDHGSDVATFVDGIPVNMPSHGHGQGYSDLHFLIPEVIESMNVFKGPYAPAFGDFATGAAVQFQTKDTLETNFFQVESAYVPQVSSITSNRALTLLQLPDGHSFIHSYVGADILRARGYFKQHQHFNRFNVFSKTIFTMKDENTLRVSISGFGSSWDASGQVPERAVELGLISRFGSIDNSEGGTTQRTNINLVYDKHFKNGELQVQAYVCNYRFKLFSNFTFNLVDSIRGDEIEQTDSRMIHGFQTRYHQSHILGKINGNFTCGIVFRSDEIENGLWHAMKRKRLETRTNALVHERSTSIYLNESLRFTDFFRLEIGGRYDYFIFDVEDHLPTDSTHVNHSGYTYQTVFTPKLQVIFDVNAHQQFFINSGSGYHSNDARSVVQEEKNHQLPRAWGAEVGSLTHITNRATLALAFWWLDLENELIYVGDEGSTENKGASRRTGIDLSLRCRIHSWLFADADLNVSKNNFINTVFGKQLKINYHIPLAPVTTSAVGFTSKFKIGLEASLRYRYMADRPANESYTITAHGYTIFDASIHYRRRQFKIGVVVENILNAKWNEAQFDTESKLPLESEAVDELHFTPGTPFSAKISVGYMF